MSVLARFRLVLMAGLCLFLGTGSLVQAAPIAFQWSLLDANLQALSASSNLLVAEFRGSACQTIHGRNQDQPLAIASTFKLYVLGELARQIQLGKVSWDEQIALTDALRSMPSGDYAWVPAGTKVSVRDLAQAMIWQSDNTATDHLITRLGRENVQKAFAAYGHSDPSLNAPLLLTREMFGIKMSQTPEWMAQWESSPAETRMEMLVQVIDPMQIDPSGGWGRWNGPTAIDGIEWFASADDLCRATAALWSMGAQPGLAPVREILTGNRYGVTDTSTWPRAGYKGGFEAGVVNMTFVLERKDGRVFFVSAGYNDPVVVVDTATARTALDPVFGCLGSYNDTFTCG
ncbi:MAG TPA: serine hydrolase [Thermomicrobiales bacterium]|nr:serine hydrolase [Thermomicrobiales bacterium]